MRRGMACVLIMTGVLWLGPAVEASTAKDAAPPADNSKDPVFVQWMVPGDPDDETILDYWSRAKQGKLDAAGYVDLGTMLFYRGYPKDAIRMYRTALDLDKKLYEAWFRIGLVQHRAMEYEDARDATRNASSSSRAMAGATSISVYSRSRPTIPAKPWSTTHRRTRSRRSWRTRKSTPTRCTRSSRSVRCCGITTTTSSPKPCPCATSNRPRSRRPRRASSRPRRRL